MIIGIDLGTTNSLVACYTEEGPKIIPNRLGENLTPSVVSIAEDGTTYVGTTAKQRKVTYPDCTVELFKRSMGTEKEFIIHGGKFRAEDISSLILRSLKEDAEAYLGQTVEQAVISVPAYFNDKQRKATKRAGELAGLKVDRIISEPTAAAISYGLHKKESDTKFLVFDLGGGTFDVSILELYGNIMEVRAVAGDNYLGGEDFNEILIQMFLRQHSIEFEALNLKEKAHVRKQAELCKIGFTDSRVSKFTCMLAGQEFSSDISIDEYERACQILLSKIRKPIERSLKDAKVKLADINEVILVGGATKLSIVRKFVSKLFGRIPNTEINPDEVVALGAAVQGAMKERNETIKEIVLTDVCPFTLGTEIVVERRDNFMENGHFLPIIERNTVIPVSRTETLYTAHDNQSKIRVRVLQGESRFAKNNVFLGEIILNVPPKRAGEESVDVTYTYDINSILEVEVTVNSTKEKKKIIIQREDGELSDEEIAARFEELSYLKIPPREEEHNKVLLFKAESLYEENVGDIRRIIELRLRDFEDVLSRQDKLEIEEARKDFKEFLDMIENESVELY